MSTAWLCVLACDVGLIIKASSDYFPSPCTLGVCEAVSEKPWTIIKIRFMLMRNFVQGIFHFICNCVLCNREQGGVDGGWKDVGSAVWAKGVALTPWPSGRLVRAEDLTERAVCHLIHTPDLRLAPVCPCLSLYISVSRWSYCRKMGWETKKAWGTVTDGEKMRYPKFVRLYWQGRLYTELLFLWYLSHDLCLLYSHATEMTNMITENDILM